MTTAMLKIVAPPQITVLPQDKNISEGTYVELTCQVKGM